MKIFIMPREPVDYAEEEIMSDEYAKGKRARQWLFS